ncbi:MAG: R3H domain-containing nucleic acid-binding protein [Clostridia bacterium]
MGVIIGKRNTLDSLQYLTTLVVNKGSESHVRVKLDTENYREQRQQTLESLAINLAKKVKKTGKRVILEPMNPYERRIIHSTLQSDPMIETHSEGRNLTARLSCSLKRKGGR